MSRQQAVLELIFAGALWGFGFVATVWALEIFSPTEVLFWRYLTALVVGEFFVFMLKFRQDGQTTPSSLHVDGKLSIPAGFLLGGMLLFQTIGLQSTTASKSGFLTALYVVFVPLISHFVLKIRQSRQVFIYSGLAILGAYGLMGAQLDSLNPGDLWTILCAFIASLHILYIGFISKRIQNPFRFNNLQTLWCLLMVGPLLFFQRKIELLNFGFSKAWFGILFLAIGSTVIGFTIQLRTQKVLNSTTASMLFLLESPFALIFGILFLSEGFGALQAMGALIIFFSALQIIRSEAPADLKSTKPQ